MVVTADDVVGGCLGGGEEVTIPEVGIVSELHGAEVRVEDADGDFQVSL